VDATDEQRGKMAPTDFVIPCMAANPETCCQTLVMGNTTYLSAPLHQLVNDATDLAAMLQRLRFEVTL
jgi:hypothetical protein